MKRWYISHSRMEALNQEHTVIVFAVLTIVEEQHEVECDRCYVARETHMTTVWWPENVHEALGWHGEQDLQHIPLLCRDEEPGV